ncbi:thymidylate synthase [bacterium]|jgi:thymidylate synthase|nr:thymidylate synthase [bacterium]
MRQYLDLLEFVLKNGDQKTDRTGTGTRSVFGYQNRYDLRDGFPLVTTKKIYFDSLVRELIWFLRGATNIYDGLNPQTKIWDAWADKDGELGPVYGYQWRKWEKHGVDASGNPTVAHVDQITELINGIKSNPDSRRHIVSAWNVADIDRMALPPCHTFFQCNVNDGHLDLQLYQRSADIALGVPFNIASYALLLMILANECDLIPRHFVHTFGDAHIYDNHFDGIKEQLTRTPLPLPNVTIAKKPIFELEFEDFKLNDYQHGDFIKFPIAV